MLNITGHEIYPASKRVFIHKINEPIKRLADLVLENGDDPKNLDLQQFELTKYLYDSDIPEDARYVKIRTPGASVTVAGVVGIFYNPFAMMIILRTANNYEQPVILDFANALVFMNIASDGLLITSITLPIQFYNTAKLSFPIAFTCCCMGEFNLPSLSPHNRDSVVINPPKYECLCLLNDHSAPITVDDSVEDQTLMDNMSEYITRKFSKISNRNGIDKGSLAVLKLSDPKSDTSAADRIEVFYIEDILPNGTVELTSAKPTDGKKEVKYMSLIEFAAAVEVVSQKDHVIIDLEYRYEIGDDGNLTTTPHELNPTFYRRFKQITSFTMDGCRHPSLIAILEGLAFEHLNIDGKYITIVLEDSIISSYERANKADFEKM